MGRDSRHESDIELDSELQSLFVAYRDACPEPEPSVNFMPEMWAKIEVRQASSNVFGRMARALVGAALAATVIFGMMLSTSADQGNSVEDTYIGALTADHVASMDPLNLDRLSEMEQQ